MKRSLLPAASALMFVAATAPAQQSEQLAGALTLHASFDDGLNADFSRGDRTCYVRVDGKLVEAAPNDDVQIADDAGRFGSALRFTRKSRYWPLFQGADVLRYDDDWDATVSVWLRLNPDRDLEPGYCDPVQIVGGDTRQGFIFLEWSKDHTPRHFRYAVRPLYHIWNPDDVGWEEIPAEKRPMVQLTTAPFSADRWTHVVFTLENVNNASSPSSGVLFINGERAGAIEGWDLTLGWNADEVQLVLGAAYVGHLDDVAVFDRALTGAEVKQLYRLPGGARELY